MNRLDTRRKVVEAGIFTNWLSREGFRVGSGVPCSWLAPLSDEMGRRVDFKYVPAAQEGDAVAIATGATLAGQPGVVTLQASGLTNAGSPLTSLTHTFKIGVLLMVSWRGEVAKEDEPQHELMGQIISDQLKLWEIEHEVLGIETDEIRGQLERAGQAVVSGESYGLIVRRGTFEREKHGLHEPKRLNKRRSWQDTKSVDEEPSRAEVLKTLLPWRDRGDVLLATTGYTGRELWQISDAPNQLYMVGSMGCVGSLGLGIAIAQPQRRVIAIDGDGALLMRLGSLATNAWVGASNLLHLVLDNGQHESTGGQVTASRGMSLAKMAYAAGYDRVCVVHSLSELNLALQVWHLKPELTFIHLKTSAGTLNNLGRPTIRPPEVAERLAKFLADD